MTERERLECVHETIKRVLKELPFTFDNLSLELTRDYEQSEMIIRFRFTEFGNNNRGLVQDCDVYFS